jgi:putative flippase GtrA
MSLPKTNFHQLKHELSHFVVFGLLGTLIDFCVYSFGHHYLSFSMAKTLSFISGSVAVYFLNKFFTFKQKQHCPKEMTRFMVFYTTTLLVNVSINSLCLLLIRVFLPLIWNAHQTFAIIMAFICATGVTTILNFIGQKFWVFKLPSC